MLYIREYNIDFCTDNELTSKSDIWRDSTSSTLSVFILCAHKHTVRLLHGHHFPHAITLQRAYQQKNSTIVSQIQLYDNLTVGSLKLQNCNM